MKLVYLILILLAGGLFSWVSGKWNRNLPRIIALIALTTDLIVLLLSGTSYDNNSWMLDFSTAWIPAFGISLHLAMDGLSLLLLLITFVLGILSVLVSWNENRNTGFFYFNLLWILSGITGVFLAMDLFLFYFFWELMLIPMYFLISIWGHENRVYASYKFFIYTQASGLLMLISIIALYFIHGNNTGVYTFDYQQLLGTTMPTSLSFVLMLGFLAAFLVKLPVVPLHNWLPDAHAEAPTAGSVILAGLLLKTGAYGLIRFVLPLFPEASVIFAPFAIVLGVVGILYGAMLAFGQTDIKRLIAYTSVSHMGFVLLGVFVFNEMAFQGVIVQILAHAISTGALFILAGQLHERIHTRNILLMGGLWKQVPVTGAMWMIFAMASLGLPGLGNFIAEFLILAGAYQSNILMACLASAGIVAATLYSLRIVQKVMLGKASDWKVKDLSLREKFISALLLVLIVYLGLFPQRVLDTAKPVINKTLHSIEEVLPMNYGSLK